MFANWFDRVIMSRGLSKAPPTKCSLMLLYFNSVIHLVSLIMNPIINAVVIPFINPIINPLAATAPGHVSPVVEDSVKFSAASTVPKT